MNKLTKTGLFTIGASLLLFGIINMTNNQKIETLPYPSAERGDVVEDFFGTQVADPYRWMEDDSSEVRAEWVKAQNIVTEDYVSQIPYRDQIRERLTELWNYPSQSAPVKHGNYYYYSGNTGLQNQNIIYRKSALDAEPEVFIDPNSLTEDGTAALGEVNFSKDGKYCAYGVSASGSDWVELRVIDTETMELLNDKINWLKFSGAIWAPDSKGFYYSAYDAPSEALYSTQNEYHKVYYHKLGDPQSVDALIFVDKQHPLRYFHADVSSDNKWQFITGSEGTSGSEILYRKRGESEWRMLLEGFKYDYVIIESHDDHAYILTNDSAPNYRFAKIDLNNPHGLVDVIAEHDKFPMQSVVKGGKYLMVSYLQDAQSKVYQYTPEGELIREVELPAIGTTDGFGGDKEQQTLFYTLTNYYTPTTIYSYNLESSASELYLAPELKFNPEDFTSEQIFFESADGERIPMIATYKKGLKMNGQNPCYLYGYGGFQINIVPRFSPAAIMFMEQGGVYCNVNLRGGSEYGEAWHKAGMLDKKQNVFNDFIGAAEWLIDNNYTSSSKLAIAGGSNGGLLVGACEVQRPDLFAVALPAVGVMDMLRYHKFTIGWGWVVEYGSSENAEQFPYIYRYSPLHNIKDGVEYPATMVTTADHDDRVVPAHSFKFAAQMQHSQVGDNPILIRIESNAGHGAGKPTSKKIDEATDTYSFLFYNTDCDYTPIN